MNNKQSRFYKFYKYILENQNKIFKLYYKDKVIEGKFDCVYETDNGLDINDLNYEEFYAIAFLNIKSNKLFEINYKTLPDKVYVDNQQIL